MLGKGTFGQVVKCLDLETNEYVAIKIVKNLPAFHSQGLVEVKLLQTINTKYDCEVFPMVRMLDSFIFRNHLCLVFELLNVSLYELIRQNQFRGLSVQLVSIFTKQILTAMVAMCETRIIHCDLKPENILLEDASSPNLKVIDFGSACFDNQAVYTYIQSRFYRAPEVILGLPYKMSIDVWSLGCIVFELFVGLPLFPGLSQHRMLMRFIKFLGMPPYKMLMEAKDTSKFFNRVGHTGTISDYVLKTDDEYSRHIAALTGNKPIPAQPFRDYYKAGTIQQIVMGYEYKTGLTRGEKEEETAMRKAMLSFLDCVLPWDPETRWTPEELLTHPFITGDACPEGPLARPAKALCNQNNPILLHNNALNANHATSSGSTPSIPKSSVVATLTGKLPQSYSTEMDEDDRSESSYMDTRSSSPSSDSVSLPGSAASNDNHYTGTSTSGTSSVPTSARSGTSSQSSALFTSPQQQQQQSALLGSSTGAPLHHHHVHHHHHQGHSGSIPSMSSLAAASTQSNASSSRAMSGPLVSKSKVPSVVGLDYSPSLPASTSLNMSGQSPYFTKLGTSPRTSLDAGTVANPMRANQSSSNTAPMTVSGSDMIIDEDDSSDDRSSTSSTLSSPVNTMVELSQQGTSLSESGNLGGGHSSASSGSGKRARAKTGSAQEASSPISSSGSGSKRHKHASTGSSSSSPNAGRRHSGAQAPILSAGSQQHSSNTSPAQQRAIPPGYSPFGEESTVALMDVATPQTEMWPEAPTMLDSSSPHIISSHKPKVAPNTSATASYTSSNSSQLQRARLAGTDMMVDFNYMGTPLDPPQDPAATAASSNLFSAASSHAAMTQQQAAQIQPQQQLQQQQQQRPPLVTQQQLASSQSLFSQASQTGSGPIMPSGGPFSNLHHLPPTTQPSQPSGPATQTPLKTAGGPQSFGKFGASAVLDQSGAVMPLVGDFEDNLTFWDGNERLEEYATGKTLYGAPGSGHLYGGAQLPSSSAQAYGPYSSQQAQQMAMNSQQSYMMAQQQAQQQQQRRLTQSSFAAALSSPTGPPSGFRGGAMQVQQQGAMPQAPGSGQYYYGAQMVGPPGSTDRPFPASNNLAVPGGTLNTGVGPSSSFGSSYPSAFGLGVSPYDSTGHHYYTGSYSSSSSFTQPTLGSSVSSSSGPWYSSVDHAASSYGSSLEPPATLPSYAATQTGLPALSSSFLSSPSSDPNSFMKRAAAGQQAPHSNIPPSKQSAYASPPNSKTFRRGQESIP